MHQYFSVFLGQLTQQTPHLDGSQYGVGVVGLCRVLVFSTDRLVAKAGASDLIDDQVASNSEQPTAN